MNVSHGACGHEKSIGPASANHHEFSVEIVTILNPMRVNLRLHHPRRCFEAAGRVECDWIGSAAYGGHLHGLRRSFAEQLETLREILGTRGPRDPGDVSAWVRETGDEAVFDGIGNGKEHDGNRARGSFGREGPSRRPDHNDVNAALDRVCEYFRIAL